MKPFYVRGIDCIITRKSCKTMSTSVYIYRKNRMKVGLMARQNDEIIYAGYSHCHLLIHTAVD